MAARVPRHLHLAVVRADPDHPARAGDSAMVVMVQNWIVPRGGLILWDRCWSGRG